MILLILILTVFDTIFLPINGWLPKIVFALVIVLGIVGRVNYKRWFVLSLSFISLALFFYLTGSGVLETANIQKLSDWGFVFLFLAVIQLLRLPNATKINNR